MTVTIINVETSFGFFDLSVGRASATVRILSNYDNVGSMIWIHSHNIFKCNGNDNRANMCDFNANLIKP